MYQNANNEFDAEGVKKSSIEGNTADKTKVDTTNLANGSTFWDFQAQTLYTWDKEGKAWV